MSQQKPSNRRRKHLQGLRDRAGRLTSTEVASFHRDLQEVVARHGFESMRVDQLHLSPITATAESVAAGPCPEGKTPVLKTEIVNGVLRTVIDCV